MKIDWFELLSLTSNIRGLQKFLERRYKKDKNVDNLNEMLFIQNLEGSSRRLKKWQEITQVIIFAVSKERLDILEPSVEGILGQNYPKDKIMVIFAAEDAYRDGFLEDFAILKKKYGRKFKAFKYSLHVGKEGEIVGKGANITNAGRKFWAEYQKKGLKPANTLVTTLDADHIMHPEYMARLTYLYVIDPNRAQKTYQPIPLLFNNIWDVPALNRIAAVSNSFWPMVESMRPFRQRIFASHTQSLAMLLLTDFWSVTVIVEDGHQTWRTFFALNGIHQMEALNLPVYQDAVLGETWWQSFKNQYLQMRRWAWGVSDFPYMVIQSIKHKEIPLFDRLTQIVRQFTGFFTWSTSSFILALTWIPLYFNKHFQDTVLAHNISVYSGDALKIAWIGIFISIWLSLFLFPPRPQKYGFMKTLSMVAQWIVTPVFAIVFSALPAIDSQTRLMLGKKLEFFIVPKVRTSEPKVN